MLIYIGEKRRRVLRCNTRGSSSTDTHGRNPASSITPPSRVDAVAALIGVEEEHWDLVMEQIDSRRPHTKHEEDEDDSMD